MYKAVFVVALLTTVVIGLPTVIDIADFDRIRSMELENSTPIENSDAKLPRELPVREINRDYDISGLKNGCDEKDEDSYETEYLTPDWSAEGSFESDEKSDRSVRSVSGSSSYRYSSGDESGESTDCDQTHESGGDSSGPDDSEPYESSEEKKKEENTPEADVKRGQSSTSPSNASTEKSVDSKPKDSSEENKKEESAPNAAVKSDQSRTASSDASTNKPVESTPRTSLEGITPTTEVKVDPTTTSSSNASTDKPIGRIDIDPRFSVVGTEVRKKRMAWNVMRSSNEFDDDAKPVKMIWRWDDQTPEIPPKDDDVYDTYGKKPDVSRPQAPVVDIQRPCDSVWERRDRNGICRLAFA